MHFAPSTDRVESTYFRTFSLLFNIEEGLMNDLLRGALAGAAAWKLGGGLISTILIFIFVFWLLGKC
jgi:hypothetical protein